MPLRDHFHAPLSDRRSWGELHGQWPAMIVIELGQKLPSRYVAGPNVQSGSSFEVDVGTFETDEANGASFNGSHGNGNGGVATAVWAPSRPTLVITTDLPAPDEYEVLVYDADQGRRLVAAIEIVSPANKDRPDHRKAFVSKCAAMLQQRVSVTIVDLVTTRKFNLYHDLLEQIGQEDPSLGLEPSPLYAVACRTTRNGKEWQLETWLKPLVVGQPLPTLPLWLADNLAVPLELERSYEETCRVLRIP